MFCPHKNSYLQLHSSGVNPRIINRAVNLAREQLTTDSADFEPPLNRLSSQQPCIPISNVDVTRRPLAFGRSAMQKLRREIHHPKEEIVIAAITSIYDLVKDPEKGYEAISLRVPDRMADLLSSEHEEIKERTCMALTALAELADGKEAITNNPKLLSHLAMVLDDVDGAVRFKAAACVEMISDFWKAAEELVSFGYVPIILDCIVKDCEEISAIHLRSLNNLMSSCDGMNEVLDFDAFEILVSILDSTHSDLKAEATKCLATLFCTSSGRELAYKENILVELNRLLHSEIVEVYQAAAQALMFATIKSSARIKATRVTHLSDRLVILLHDYYNPPSQMYCLQTLINLCEHPVIRKHVLDKYYDEIAALHVGSSKELLTLRDNLLKVGKWQPECA